MDLNAHMNNGRWLIICPECGTALPAWETGVVCPRCYPDMMAKAFRPLRNGDLRPVPDVERIDSARALARKNDHEYFPAFPAEKQQIELILRMRPARKNMNWIESETLADLQLQNIEHGDAVPEIKE